MNTQAPDSQAPGVLRSLGARELSILRAVLADEPFCSAHPSYGDRCSCDASEANARWADAAEARRIESDDRDTGLTLDEREALLGWLVAHCGDGPGRAPLSHAALREIVEGDG